MLREEAVGADGPGAWSSREKRRRVNGRQSPLRLLGHVRRLDAFRLC